MMNNPPFLQGNFVNDRFKKGQKNIHPIYFNCRKLHLRQRKKTQFPTDRSTPPPLAILCPGPVQSITKKGLWKDGHMTSTSNTLLSETKRT